MSTVTDVRKRPEPAVILTSAWEARCECGWFGGVYRSHFDAGTEAKNHQQKAHPRPSRKGSYQSAEAGDAE